ncbi:MAG: ester cyclase [Actinomycetia bacterium]|nr:ester cyclase [Actinomycetes bacterium]
MSTEANKAIVARHAAALNDHDLSALDEIWDPDLVWHGKLRGLGLMKELIAESFRAFPDFRATIDDEIAEGDRVVLRFTAHGTHEGEFRGIPPTGKRVTWTGINIYRLEGGKIVERWVCEDGLSLMEQLRGP